MKRGAVIEGVFLSHKDTMDTAWPTFQLTVMTVRFFHLTFSSLSVASVFTLGGTLLYFVMLITPRNECRDIV